MTSRWATGVALCRLVPALLVLGLLKHVVPLPSLVRWAWAAPRRRGQVQDAVIAARVWRAGDLAGMPDRDCLQRSLLLYRELSREGYAPELVVGVQRTGGSVLGHVWVRLAGRVVGEPEPPLEAFAPVLTFGAGGRRV